MSAERDDGRENKGVCYRSYQREAGKKIVSGMISGFRYSDHLCLFGRSCDLVVFGR